MSLAYPFVCVHPLQANNIVITVADCVDEGIQFLKTNIKMLQPFHFLRVRYFSCMLVGRLFDKLVHILDSNDGLDMEHFDIYLSSLIKLINGLPSRICVNELNVSTTSVKAKGLN